ncbi:hypothetical protein HMPREF1210_01731 [Paenisporosarcina sp. HGH0030]|uniref:hypothetical protein n=1 Tax=Paenisporosarcina sp. HGH0030 TaxID=1078085 RepID=UPI00034E95D9|nr:hypothetical protein [Paenisporosarcina sp. HGH0030]EPD51619.1 hypothetical protein HMPREF1210_01731 [Paenisporosarcina sp. HGH0030]
MWKKATMVFGMSALLLVGCNMNNDKVPGNETPMENDVENDVNDVENNVNDDVNDVREDTQDLVPGTEGENHVDPTKEDQNKDNDKDMMKDANTDEEEILEDDMDRRDADNKDE